MFKNIQILSLQNIGRSVLIFNKCHYENNHSTPQKCHTFVCVCRCAVTVYRCLRRPEEGARIPETGVTNSSEPPTQVLGMEFQFPARAGTSLLRYFSNPYSFSFKFSQGLLLTIALRSLSSCLCLILQVCTATPSLDFSEFVSILNVKTNTILHSQIKKPIREK